MYKLICFAIAATVSGCATQYRLVETTFKPVDDNKGFEYKALAAADVGGFDSTSGEEFRGSTLKEWLRLNGMCPHGYTITSRTTAVDAEGLFGKRGYVYYQGKCTV